MMGHIVVVTGMTAVTTSGEILVHSFDSASQLVTVIRLYEYTVDLDTAGMTSTTTMLVATAEKSEVVAFDSGVTVELPTAVPIAYDASLLSEHKRTGAKSKFQIPSCLLSNKLPVPEDQQTGHKICGWKGRGIISPTCGRIAAETAGRAVTTKLTALIFIYSTQYRTMVISKRSRFYLCSIVR